MKSQEYLTENYINNLYHIRWKCLRSSKNASWSACMRAQKEREERKT
jgi:hypothetical protein